MTRYRAVRDVRWSVGAVSVTLVDGRGRAHTLGYPEAAIFDFLSRGYAFSKVLALTSHIASVDAAAADALVRSTLEEWVDLGILERV